MKKVTKTVLAVLILIGSALQDPSVQHAIASAVLPVLASHPHLSALAGSLFAIFALLHDPKSPS